MDGIQEIKNGNYTKGLRQVGLAVLPFTALASFVAYTVYNQFGKSPLTLSAPTLPTLNLDLYDVCQISHLQYLCTGNLGVPRWAMPQIEGLAKAVFLAMIGEMACVKMISPTQLTPVQKEMNLTLVKVLLQKHRLGTYDPCDREIIVSEFFNQPTYIIDGHHRYVACSLLHRNQKIIAVNRSVSEILKSLQELPGICHENL